MKKTKVFFVFIFVISLMFAFGKPKTKKNRSELKSHKTNEIVFTFNFDSYGFKRVRTPKGIELVVWAPNSGKIMKRGAPDLVKLSTAVIIPDKEKMRAKVIDSEYIELDHIPIAPSKGNLSRKIDPRNVPYTYGKVYKKDKFYPGNLVELTKAYIARDFRGLAVIGYPLQYNPYSGILRIYKTMTVRVWTKNNKGENAYDRKKPLKMKELHQEFKRVYSRHFINFEAMAKQTEATKVLQYTTLPDPIGNYLIVCYDSYMDEMADFVSWKQSIGYNVDLVSYSTIGSSSALKNYVEDYYNTNGLTYLLLVGDHAQVPTSSTSAGDSDNNYAYIVGNDHYLDIFVGRFSATLSSHVTTQANRTIYYERDLSSSASWFHRAVGMASNEGPGHNGEYDATHMNYILNDLEDYGYTTYKNYQDGGSPSNLTNLINSGKGGLWYVGHGSTTSWSSINYDSGDVNNLTNTNLLPYIISVACYVGNFRNSTCFCETWLRATSGGIPTGGLVHAGSTISQSWNPPMDAQDEMADILTSSSSSAPKRTFGGIFVNGMFKMNDLNGSAGYNMTDTWVCFGDASVQLRTPQATEGPGQTTSPPTANFTGSPTTVSPGGSVSFTDTSSGNPTSWSWSFEGGSPSSSSSQNPTVTYNNIGTFNVSLTATNSYGSDTETKTNYITVTDVVTYCTSSGNDQGYEYIKGVTVGDMTNNSGSSGYSDFTSMTAHLTEGASTNIALVPGFTGSSYNEYWKIWIDYNKDGDFTDSGEEVFSGNGNSTVNGSFTVKSGTAGVNTRMRVTMQYNSPPSSPCGTFTYGEVEDYTVEISGSTVQPPVANFSASSTNIMAGESVSFSDTSSNNPTSWSWTFEGGSPSSSSSKNPTVTYNNAGTFDVSLTATNSAGSDTETKTNYITVTAQPPQYCTASGNNQNYEYISRVQVGSINNSSGASGYSDFTSISTNVSKGGSVSVSLTPGFVSGDWPEYWEVWIDYNRDGDFTDSGEKVFSGNGRSTVSGNFTVPTSASSGSTRMRVIMQYNSYYGSSCGTFTYGEVEDYTVNIQ